MQRFFESNCQSHFKKKEKDFMFSNNFRKVMEVESQITFSSEEPNLSTAVSLL